MSLKKIFQTVYNFIVRYPLAIVASIFVVAFAVVAIAFGNKIQVGGILSWLWGNSKKPSPNVRVIPPEDRKKPGGEPIPAGVPDENGYTQIPKQIEIKDPGIFSDPKVITINHPEKGNVDLVLPEGVKNSDVKTIVEIQPGIYEISNNDSGVNPSDILKEIE